MIGAKAGNRVVVIGGSHAALAAEIALVTGLNGETLVVDSNAATGAAVETAARSAGALLEFREASLPAMPIETGSFTIAVLTVPLATIPAPAQRALVEESVRVLAPGGRLVIIDGGARTGWRDAMRKAPPRASESEIVQLIADAGAVAGRRLGGTPDVDYYEGRKSR